MRNPKWGYIMWPIQYDWLATLSMTISIWLTWLWVWPTKVKCHKTKVPKPRTNWDTYPTSQAPIALLALKVLLNATQKVKSLWVKVKSHMEVGNLNEVWLVILQSNKVILQGTLVGHLKSVVLKDLVSNFKKNFKSKTGSHLVFYIGLNLYDGPHFPWIFTSNFIPVICSFWWFVSVIYSCYDQLHISLLL